MSKSFKIFLPLGLPRLFILHIKHYAYLRDLIVHRKNRDVKADPEQSATVLVTDGKGKLDVSGVGAYILHGWHVGHFHIVHSMLQSK